MFAVEFICSEIDSGIHVPVSGTQSILHVMEDCPPSSLMCVYSCVFVFGNTATDNETAKVLSYNRANRAVAILCNHQVSGANAVHVVDHTPFICHLRFDVIERLHI